jgi:hypothetical protein
MARLRAGLQRARRCAGLYLANGESGDGVGVVCVGRMDQSARAHVELEQPGCVYRQHVPGVSTRIRLRYRGGPKWDVPLQGFAVKNRWVRPALTDSAYSAPSAVVWK